METTKANWRAGVAMWFSPMGVLLPWQQLTGNTDQSMKGNMAVDMVKWIITSFLMACVLVHAVHYSGATGPLMGAAVGFLNWLGFIFTVQYDMNAATKAPFKLLVYNTGSQLISLLIMGAILATWT